MCGIVGVFPIQSDSTKISPELQKALALWFHNEVLYHTVKRGKDATGFVATFGAHPEPEKFPDPYFWSVLKQPSDVDDFFDNDGTDKKYAGQDKLANVHALLDKFSRVKRPLLHLIGHTRAKTQGSELNPDNNHPIVVSNIIGVHNGGVRNHKKIYEKLNIKGIGEVDSEAIMQLLNLCAPDRALTIDDAAYVTERIEGPRAVMAFNNKHPETIVFFRNDERPMEISFLDNLGLMVVHSERDFMRSALASYTRLRLLYGKTLGGEGELPEIDELSITVPKDQGGVIDITKPYNEGTLTDFLGVQKLPDTLAEYKNVTTTTTTTSAWTGKTGGNYSGHSGGYSTGHSSVYTPPAAQAGNVEAEVNDLSDYKAAEGDSPGESVTVPSTELMDDPGTPDGEVTIEVTVPSDDAEAGALAAAAEEDYDDSEEVELLRQQALDCILEKDFLSDRDIVFNRLKGKLAKLVNLPNVDEMKAAEAIQNAYPELFSDGYVKGYQACEFEMTDLSDTEEVISENGKLSRENEQLRKENELLKKQLHKSASHMANLKGFLLATCLLKDLVYVERNTVYFDDDIEDLFMSSLVFKDVNISRIRELFSKKEKKMISEGLTAQARGKQKARTIA